MKITLLYGGRSAEHDVSVLSAFSVLNAIYYTYYQVQLIFISKEGQWVKGPLLTEKPTSKEDLHLTWDPSGKVTDGFTGRVINPGEIKEEGTIVFPVLHGPNGEDGTIQGYLNLIGIPYVGSSIYSSVIAQDKVFMKQVMQANDIPVTKFVWFGERFYRNKKEELFKQIDELKYPLIIKPATLGGCVGIETITQKEEIDSTIERAFKFDSKVIIEEKIEDLIEYNCSVLLTPNGNITSEIEEIKTSKEILEYGDKFLVGEALKDSSLTRTCPAEISEKLRKEIETYSLAVFKMLNMRGTARIDFLYDTKKKLLYIDEINNIPWCFAHHLWEAKNITYQELLNIMLKDATQVAIKHQEMTLTIDNDIIKNTTNAKLKEMK